VVAGLLLTGGSSRRMGRDKAELVVAGERLADHAARVLTNACEPVLEIGPGRSELEAMHDDEPSAGPLAALVTGARALRARGYEGPVLLLGVDLPFADQPLLELLVRHPAVETVVPIAGGMRQSCCARYAPPALAAAADLVEQGERAMHALLSAVPVVEISEAEWRAVAPADALADLDTPEDLARHGIDPGSVR
jgi:molybdenum cofactor guanylyltransferase